WLWHGCRVRGRRRVVHRSGRFLRTSAEPITRRASRRDRARAHHPALGCGAELRHGTVPIHGLAARAREVNLRAALRRFEVEKTHALLGTPTYSIRDVAGALGRL